MPRTIGIRVFKGDELVGEHVFHRDIIKIGRLASAHLRLEDPKVSRIHAVIDITGAGQEVSIIDMGSAEGTRVNGDKVSRVNLKHADEVGLGDSRLVVVLAGAEVDALAGVVGMGGDAGADEASPHSFEAASTRVVQTANEELSSLQVPDQSSVFETSAEVQAELDAAAIAVAAGDDTLFRSPPTADQAPLAASPPPRPRRAPPAAAGAMPIMGLAPIPEDSITPENRHLEVALRWGGDVIELKRIRGEPKFVIGAGDGVDFFIPLEGTVTGSSFELVRQRAGGAEWVVRYTKQMGGTVTRGGQTVPLAEAGGMPEGEGFSLSITDDMEVTVSIGYFTLEIRNVAKSRAMAIPPLLDMFFLNTVLVALFSWASIMSVLLLMPLGLDTGDDDLFTNPGDFQTLILKPPPKDNDFLNRLKGAKSKAAEAAKNDKGQAGKKEAKPDKNNRASFKAKADKPTDEQIVASKLQQLFGDSGNQGIAALFGADVSGGELQTLLGGISGAKAGESYGVGGLGLRGSGPGGGGTGVATMGIGGVGTRGRGTGDASYGSGEGGLGSKGDRDVRINMGTPLVYGSLDKEIIRRVVRENQAQIRYCYERELTRTPGIMGKIVAKWVITGTGSVRQAQIVESQMNNKAVESCLSSRIQTWTFPKPKGGGIVVVTYPFVFKKSG
jgi:hypothetical protein